MGKRLLIAPLDWGLGHTTRCIPIAQFYFAQGFEIFFAGNETQQRLFVASCPFATLLSLDGYNVTYPNRKWWFMPMMALQLPKIWRSICREHSWLQEKLREYKFDYIISDNRYGLYSTEVPSFILTHQLQVQTGTHLGNWAIARCNQYLLGKFQSCWIVDYQHYNLAGKLSQYTSNSSSLTLRNIGWLSQFTAKGQDIDSKTDGSILAIISGPEPMRTQFEQLLLAQMRTMPDQTFVLIAGNASATIPQDIPTHVNYIKLADAETCLYYMKKANFIISRSGYTTVMDLIALGKTAYLVPTPGQSEQEYLAAYLKFKNYFNSGSQDSFDLKKILEEQFSYRLPEFQQVLPQLT